MNAEAALLGVPTLSAFQGSLYTDAYLMREGLLKKAIDPESLLGQARACLKKGFKERFMQKAKSVLDSMEDPVYPITGLIQETIGVS